MDFNQRGIDMKTQEFNDILPDELISLSNYLEVPASGCKWPGAEFLSCCGRIRDGKSPYCEVHHRKAAAVKKPAAPLGTTPRPKFRTPMTLLIGDIG